MNCSRCGREISEDPRATHTKGRYFVRIVHSSMDKVSGRRWGSIPVSWTNFSSLTSLIIFLRIVVLSFLRLLEKACFARGRICLAISGEV